MFQGDAMSSFEFATTINGKLYQGTFAVSRETITVKSEFGAKTIQVRNMPPKLLARMMLGEIVREEMRRRGTPLPP